MADDLLYNDDIDLSPDDLDVSDGTSTGSDESTQDNPLNRWVIDTDTNAGTPGENPPTITPPTAPSEIHNVSVSVRRRYLIPTYDQDELQKIALTGATFYAVYTDGTEEICDYTDVVEPVGLAMNEIVLEGEAIARAVGQHFWTDTQGVHVTDVIKDDWLDATVDQFDDLSSNKPYHNILMNSEGLLLRSALNNFISLSRSGNTIYDGYGNNLENVLASFTYAGATFREEGKTKALINSRGLTLYDDSGTVSNNQETLGTSIAQLGTNVFGEPYSRIGKENGNHITIEQDGIYGWNRNNLFFGAQINSDGVPEMYISKKASVAIRISGDIRINKNNNTNILYYIRDTEAPGVSKLYDIRIEEYPDNIIYQVPIGIMNSEYDDASNIRTCVIKNMSDQVLYTVVWKYLEHSENRTGISDKSYVVSTGYNNSYYYEFAWYDANGNETSDEHIGEYVYINRYLQPMSYEFPHDGLTFSGGDGSPYIDYNDDRMIPLFHRDSWSSDLGTLDLPTLPCLVYSASDKNVRYCGLDEYNSAYSELIGGFVNKSGDTMTGTLTSNGNVDIRNLNVTVDTTSNNHVDTNRAAGYVIRDSTGLWYGRCEGVAYTDGRIETRISAINTKTDGSRVENDLSLYVAKNGTRSVWVTDSAPWRSALNVVNKSGDTMTGNLHISASAPYFYTNDSRITLNTSSNNKVSANAASGFVARGSDGGWLARYETLFLTNGDVRARLGARNIKTNNSVVENTLEIGVKKDGTRTIGVTDPAVWRSALGVPATSHTHNTTTVTQISTLSSPTSITHLGYYAFGAVGGALLTKWNAAGAANPGDYHGVVHDFNGSSSGCVYGTMIVTSPRSDRIFIVRVWNGAWESVRQI